MYWKPGTIKLITCSYELALVEHLPDQGPWQLPLGLPWPLLWLLLWQLWLTAEACRPSSSRPSSWAAPIWRQGQQTKSKKGGWGLSMPTPPHAMLQAKSFHGPQIVRGSVWDVNDFISESGLDLAVWNICAMSSSDLRRTMLEPMYNTVIFRGRHFLEKPSTIPAL